MCDPENLRVSNIDRGEKISPKDQVKLSVSTYCCDVKWSGMFEATNSVQDAQEEKSSVHAGIPGFYPSQLQLKILKWRPSRAAAHRN